MSSRTLTWPGWDGSDGELHQGIQPPRDNGREPRLNQRRRILVEQAA